MTKGALTPPDYKKSAQDLTNRLAITGTQEDYDNIIATALTQADALGYARGREEGRMLFAAELVGIFTATIGERREWLALPRNPPFTEAEKEMGESLLGALESAHLACQGASVRQARALTAEPAKPCQCGSPILRWVHQQPPKECGKP